MLAAHGNKITRGGVTYIVESDSWFDKGDGDGYFILLEEGYKEGESPPYLKLSYNSVGWTGVESSIETASSRDWWREREEEKKSISAR